MKTKTLRSTCILAAGNCSDASRRPSNVDWSTAPFANPTNAMALRHFQDQSDVPTE